MSPLSSAGVWDRVGPAAKKAREGLGVPELYENFEQMLSYDPDLVVYALTLNDPETSDSFRARHAFVYERIARGWDVPPRPLFRMGALISAAGKALLSGGDVRVELNGKLVVRLKGGDISIPLHLTGHLTDAS